MGGQAMNLYFAGRTRFDCSIAVFNEAALAETVMFDLKIAGATIVDGKGAPSCGADA